MMLTLIKRLFSKSELVKHPMLEVFKKHKCIFFHIPKTAGLSVSHSLFGNIDWGHRTVNDYKNYFGEELFQSYYKFSFVRNPYQRLYSAFIFLKKGGINSQDLAFSKNHLSDYDCFEDFVKEGLHKKEIMEWVHFKPQHYFLTDKDGNLVMDFIGKMERIDEDFRHVCLRLKQSAELKTLNKSQGKMPLLSDEIKAIIKSKYQKDFTLFYPDL